jgi:hypothetical protein
LGFAISLSIGYSPIFNLTVGLDARRLTFEGLEAVGQLAEVLAPYQPLREVSFTHHSA